MIKVLYKIYQKYDKKKYDNIITRKFASIPQYAMDALNSYTKKIDLIDFKKSKCYQFTWESVNVELTFFSVSKEKLHSKDAIALISFYITILNFHIHKTRTLKIILVPFKNTKQLPFKTDIISSEHANSGYSNGSYIFIYREEEMFKVLIHEMIHYYDIDFKDTHYDEYFVKKYNIRPTKTQLRIFESYTDILAIMFSSFAYICFSLKNNNKKTEKRFTEYYVRILENVKTNVIHTVSNIMNHYTCESFCGFQEDTHIFSYYVCKAALMYNYRDFLGWLRNDIVLNDVRVHEYVKRLDSYLSNEDFQKEVNLQIKKGTRDTSLRMFMYHLKGM